MQANPSSPQIHPTALIHPSSQFGSNCTIGPYSVIGPNVTLGNHCQLHSHVVIDGHSSIGDNNEFFPFAAIGQKTQDLKYNGEPTSLVIGSHNTFRENTTIHRGTTPDAPTHIGDHNLFLAYSHVAHDCLVHNYCILSNNGTLGGHVVMEDYAILSGLAGVHQFCRLGSHSLVGGCTKIVKDVPPYTIVDGSPAAVRGLNTTGLQRRNFPDEDLAALKHAYKALFLDKSKNLSQALTPLLVNPNPHIQHLAEFISASQRGIIR